MPVTRLNHAVLFVRDLERTVKFYEDALGFHVMFDIPKRAAFLQADGSTNDHDLGVFAIGEGVADSPAGRGAVGLYHLAWEVDTLDELERIGGQLASLGALTGATDHGTTKAYYGRDPDGLEFEVCWLVPADLLTDDIGIGNRPLDIVAEKARYGGQTRGGVGISSPTAV